MNPKTIPVQRIEEASEHLEAALACLEDFEPDLFKILHLALLHLNVLRGKTK